MRPRQSSARSLAADVEVDDFAYVPDEPFVLPKERPIWTHLADSPAPALVYEQPVYKLVSWQGDFINVTLSAPVLLWRCISSPPDYYRNEFYTLLDHAIDLCIAGVYRGHFYEKP